MKTKTKILSVLMTVAILLSSLVLVFPTFAAETEGEGEPTLVVPTTNWSENAATAFANGDGSEANPYIISTAAELAYLANAAEADEMFDNGKYFKLADADGNPVVIDLSAHLWDKPIGSFGKEGASTNSRFMGHFNGNGSTIKGMIVRKTVSVNGDATALFGAVAGGGVIENFFLEADIEATVTKQSQQITISALTGTHGAATIKNVHATAKIVATQAPGAENCAIGGLTGITHNGTLEDSSMSGELTAYLGKKTTGGAQQCVIGGIASTHVSKATYTRVTNNMNITLYKGFANSYAGGIVGAAGLTSTVDGANPIVFTGCVNNGNIYAYSNDANGTGGDNMRFGGIIGGTGRNVYGGKVTHPVTVQQCINTGKIGGQKTTSSTGATSVYSMNGTAQGGFGMIVGYVESAFTLKQCYVPYLEDNTSKADAIYHFKNSVDKVTDGNGYVGKSPATRGMGTDSDIMMEVGVYKVEGTDAYVAASFDSLNAFKVAGFTMELVYGTQTVTSFDALTWGGEGTEDLAIAKLTYEEGAVPTLQVTKTVNGKTYTYNAVKGLSWAGMTDGLAEEVIPFDEEQKAYLISTPEQLGTLANSVNRYIRLPSNNVNRFLLVNDIDLAGFEWMPIGSTHSLEHGYFAGILDGDGYSIKNMTLTREKYLYAQGFLGYMGAPSEANITTIKNVNFVDPVIAVAAMNQVNIVPAVAVIAGSMYNGVIDNVHVTGLNMYSANDTAGILYGGIAGYCAVSSAKIPTSISNSSVQGEMNFVVEQKEMLVGGLIARGRKVDIENCVTDVDINIEVIRPEGASDGGDIFVSGLVGKVHANADTEFVTVKNCTSKGDINVITDAYDGSKFGNIGIGGLVGGAAHNTGIIATGSLTMTNCVSMGNFTLENYVDLLGAEGIGSFIGNDLLSDEATVTLTGCVGFNTDVAVGNKRELTVMDATSVANNLSLAIKDGARVRIAPDALDNSGLRFDAVVNYEFLQVLEAAGYLYNIGVAITPEANLAAVYGDWNALEEDVSEGMLTVDAAFVEEATGSKDYNFTGAIINLYESNYTTNFTATAFFEILIGEDVVRIFADNSTTRNIKDVAQAAIDDPYGDYTEAQLDILNAYLAA